MAAAATPFDSLPLFLSISEAQATHLMRVRAMAKCWTTETIPEATDWRTGAITVDCQVGDAVSCTCFSDAWLMLSLAILVSRRGG